MQAIRTVGIEFTKVLNIVCYYLSAKAITHSDTFNFYRCQDRIEKNALYPNGIGIKMVLFTILIER